MHMVYHIAASIMPVKILAQLRVLQRESFEGKQIDLANYAYIVLVQEACNIVGACCLREHDPAVARSLECLCVHKNYRRKGIGSSIIEYVQKELGDLPIVLHIDNGFSHNRLLGFYQARNFEIVEQCDKETMMATVIDDFLITKQEYDAAKTVRMPFHII